ncbi:uncharacterized protein LOC143341313 [Colletes latitarsis]|uniref:uncharacterized protein LOC143341313 n=1 Tax=Colletes latitarsis TaxID=2605962 RepID=UPI00403605EB
MEEFTLLKRSWSTLADRQKDSQGMKLKRFRLYHRGKVLKRHLLRSKLQSRKLALSGKGRTCRSSENADKRSYAIVGRVEPWQKSRNASLRVPQTRRRGTKLFLGGSGR